MTAEERQEFAELFAKTLRRVMEEQGYDLDPSIWRGCRELERCIRKTTGFELKHFVIAHLLQAKREPTYSELVLIDSTLGTGWFKLPNTEEGK